jgi:NADH-quinone oxidoreductase subunit G
VRALSINMPKLTIDGKQIDVPKGTRVIEAAKQVGVDVPFYCYHPGLSVAGNCRMCLVEVEKAPKLQIACHMECQDGMVVKTDTEKVKQTRKHVLEFLLVNHPLDCPVCDQAGECWLQDYYLNYGAYDSRVSEDKDHKPKAVPIGPNVMLDAERCILCSRCVRFCDEVSKTSELGIVNRGSHSEIQVFPGKELDNKYSGNTVDICPVGALTDRDFRFKLRVWYLESKNSVCNGCARGCNTQMQYRRDRQHHARGERVMRLKPRFNENVNKWWLCDEGRYGYKFIDQNRIANPMKRLEGKVSEVLWEEILPEISNQIKLAQGKIGVFISPQLSNEDLFIARRVFKENLKLNDVFLVKAKPDGYEDDILIRADKNPNSKGAQVMGFDYDETRLKEFFNRCAKGEVEGIIIFGQDILTLHGAHLAESAFNKLKWSVFIGANHNVTSEYATYVLPAATYAEKEGTFTNFEGCVQRFDKVLEPLAESRADWWILILLAKTLGIHMDYLYSDEIFRELALSVEHFKDLDYDKLKTEGTDIRVLAEPMIPKLTQDSGLIFYTHKPEDNPTAAVVPGPQTVKTQ